MITLEKPIQHRLCYEYTLRWIQKWLRKQTPKAAPQQAATQILHMLDMQQHVIIPSYRKMVASVLVDFAEGCTGAPRQASRWVMRARSFASGSFPQYTGSTLGPPHKAAHMPKNPESLRIPHACQPVCGGCGNKQQVTSCDKLTTESDTCFLSLTPSNMPPLIAKYPGNVFQREAGKKWFYHYQSRVRSVVGGLQEQRMMKPG